MALGVKTGGRQKGTPNKATAEIRDAFSDLLSYSKDHMIEWIQKVAIENPEKALALCIQAAEYTIPKLARSEMTGADGKDLIPDTINLNFIKPNAASTT